MTTLAQLEKKLTREQLEKIIYSESLEDLCENFKPEEFKIIITCAADNSLIKQLNSTPPAFRSAINATALTIDTFCYVFSYVELTVLGVVALPLTISVFACGLLVGGYYFYDTYKDNNQKKMQLLHDFQIINLKLQAFDELIKLEKHEQKISPSEEKNDREWKEYSPLHNPYFIPQNKPPSYFKSAVSGLGVTITLGSAFILGSVYLFQSLGYLTISAAIASPFGLGAIAVAIGIGIYFGYKHYQAKKSQHLIELGTKSLQNHVRNKQHAYEALVKKRYEFEARPLSRFEPVKQEISSSLHSENKELPALLLSQKNDLSRDNVRKSSSFSIFGRGRNPAVPRQLLAKPA